MVKLKKVQHYLKRIKNEHNYFFWSIIAIDHRDLAGSSHQPVVRAVIVEPTKSFNVSFVTLPEKNPARSNDFKSFAH